MIVQATISIAIKLPSHSFSAFFTSVYNKNLRGKGQQQKYADGYLRSISDTSETDRKTGRSRDYEKHSLSAIDERLRLRTEL